MSKTSWLLLFILRKDNIVVVSVVALEALWLIWHPLSLRCMFWKAAVAALAVGLPLGAPGASLP